MYNRMKLWAYSPRKRAYKKDYWTRWVVGKYFRKIISRYMDLYYRMIRYLNRYITFTPEFQKRISREAFIVAAKNYIDYPYILGWDGSSKNIGIDCSHLISCALIDAWCVNRYFYRTARYLRDITTEVQSESEIRPGDLLFLWDDTGNIGHVAIILEVLWHESLKILDASGPSTGIWSTKIREIQIKGEKYVIGSLTFIR